MCGIVGYIGKIQNYDTYYASYKDKGYALADLIVLDGVKKTHIRLIILKLQKH